MRRTMLRAVVHLASAPCSGGPLDAANVAIHLDRMARERPFATAIVAPRAGLRNAVTSAGALSYETATYRDLRALAREYAAGLAEIGFERGARAVVMVPPSIAFFALVFGMFEAGIVPVVLDPGMGIERLGRCIERAAPSGFLGVLRAHLARLAFGWGERTIRTSVVVGPGASSIFARGSRMRVFDVEDVRRRGATSGRRPCAALAEDDVAAILFTSGSTGVPKGAVYTHGNFAAQVEAIRATFDIAPGEIDLPTFPLFALFDPALGMTTVLPRMDFTRPGAVNPHHIVEPIRRFGVTNMFGSPALLDVVASSFVGRSAPERPLLPSLKRVITAGAPVGPRILEAFARLLSPEATIHTPYGATEALPIATIDHRTILDETRARTNQGEGICVGRPVSIANVEILRIHDGRIDAFGAADRVAPGEVGEICVAGPQVTRAYFNDDENTRHHKITGPDGRLYHRVGDVGWRDETGRLWFCGRKAHRVEIDGRTYFSERVEGPFNALPGVRRTAFVGPTHRGRVVGCLCIEPFERARRSPLSRLGSERARERRIVAALIPAPMRSTWSSTVERFFVVDRFPVDPRHNAKIDRDALRRWCQNELARGRGVDWGMLDARHR